MSTENLVLLLVAAVVWTIVGVVAYRLLSLPSRVRREFRAGGAVGVPHDDFSAHVAHVIDGDTVDVVTKGRKFRVRLDSIDCPEDGQEWGDTAKFGLIKLIGGKLVHLENHGVDSYGRVLATIYVSHEDGREKINVNERMVVLGHAWVMRGFYDHLPKKRQDSLNRIERWAQSRNVGLWKTQNPVPPWQWRASDRDRLS